MNAEPKICIAHGHSIGMRIFAIFLVSILIFAIFGLIHTIYYQITYLSDVYILNIGKYKITLLEIISLPTLTYGLLFNSFPRVLVKIIFSRRKIILCDSEALYINGVFLEKELIYRFNITGKKFGARIFDDKIRYLGFDKKIGNRFEMIYVFAEKPIELADKLENIAGLTRGIVDSVQH